MSKSIEVRPNIWEITPKTTELPPGGANVRISGGVPIQRGDFGDVAGRGIRVEPNGQPIHPCAPEGYTGRVANDGWPQGVTPTRIPY